MDMLPLPGNAVLLPLATALTILGGRAVKGPTCEVPIEVYDGHVYLPVDVAGVGVRSFILDSAAGRSALDRALAEALHRSLRPLRSMRGAGGEITAGSADSVDVRVGGCRVHLPTVTVLPIDSVVSPFAGRPLPGILGFELFRERVVEVDYAGRRVRLYGADDYTSPATAVVLPARLQGGLWHVEGRLTLSDGTAYPLDLVLDLGAKRVLFTTPFVRRTGVTGRVSPTVMGTIGAGIAGETRFLLARVGAVEVGSVGYQAPVVGFSEGSALDLSLADGVVGTAFLHRFTVVFDHPRSRVLLIPNDARPEADEFDMSGLPLTSPAPGRVVVHRVLPGSPAAAAGVEPGDLLRGVDGVPVRRYTLDGLRELLARGPGSRHALVVLRDGEERSVVIRLRRLV